MFLKYISAIIKLPVIVMVVILYIHYFFPQRWGFYTIEPKVPLYSIYKVHNGLADKRPFTANNMTYGMGISFRGKILYRDLFSIVNNKSLPWNLLIEDSLNYITNNGNYILLSKLSEYNTFEGKFLITKTERASYLILKKGDRLQPLTQYILVDIR